MVDLPEMANRSEKKGERTSLVSEGTVLKFPHLKRRTVSKHVVCGRIGPLQALLNGYGILGAQGKGAEQ